jgi:hypothetical protein
MWWKITSQIWRDSPSMPCILLSLPQFTYNKSHCSFSIFDTWILKYRWLYKCSGKSRNAFLLGLGSHKSLFLVAGTRSWYSSDFCSAFLGCYYFGVMYYLQDQLFLPCYGNTSSHDGGRLDTMLYWRYLVRGLHPVACPLRLLTSFNIFVVGSWVKSIVYSTRLLTE